MRLTSYFLPLCFIFLMVFSSCTEDFLNPDDDDEEEVNEEEDDEEGSVDEEFTMEGVMVEYAFREEYEDPRQNFYIQYNDKGQPLQVADENGTLQEEFIYSEDGGEVEWRRYYVYPDGSDHEYDGKNVMELTADGFVTKLDRYNWNDEMVETREYVYDADHRITNILTSDGYVDHKVVWENGKIDKLETYMGDALMNTLQFEYSGFSGMPKKGWGPAFFGVLDGILPGPPFSSDFDYRFGMVNPLFTLGPLNFIGRVPSEVPARAVYEDATASNQSTTFVYTTPSNDDQDDQYDGWYVYTLRSLSSTPFYEKRYEFVYYSE